MRSPANAGPIMRARFQPVVLRPMAANSRWSGMSSGTKACRAGMDNASTAPLKNPNQMKSQKPTLPEKMMIAMITVAIQLRPCA